MTRTVIAAAVIAAAGVYLRWGIRPVVICYQAGRQAERIATRRRTRPE